MHAVALKLLLQSGEYETETHEWSKLPEDQQTWVVCKTTFREAYVTKIRSEAAQVFWSSKSFDHSCVSVYILTGLEQQQREYTCHE